MIHANSLIAGKMITGQERLDTSSPVDGNTISQVNLLNLQQLEEAFLKAKAIKRGEAKIHYAELYHLANFFKKNRLKFVKQIMQDSGFIEKDAKDLVECSIEFCEDYELHIKEISRDGLTTSFSFRGTSQKIKLTSEPFGIISATTPRNTPLITELTIIVHALWSGNVCVLRPSPGVAGTVSLLIEGLLENFSAETLAKLFVTFSDAKDFVNISLEYADLLHYVGSSKYLENTLIAGIQKGVKVLVDGDGCSMVIVDATTDLKKAARVCYEGLIRCNAQVCISIRTIIVDEDVYTEFLSYFLTHIRGTSVKPPVMGEAADMGPLFSSAQAENIRDISKKYKILYEETESKEFGANYLNPIVVELEPNDHNFLKEHLFGPMVGIASFKNDGWKNWLEDNSINLTDVVFSESKEFIKDFLATSKSPRKVVNTDPTLESVFEPWGAFLPSGWNDVSYWYDKYRNYYQVVRKPK